MSETKKSPSAVNGFRITVVLFACVLGSLAAWILSAEILRPSDIKFITSTQSAALRRDATVMAARVGVVRGDLWSEAAFAYADTRWAEDKNAPNAPFEQTQAVAEQAIAHAPHDSRLWLILAANYLRFDWLSERASAALKMSYYTGSNTIAVLPQRLLLAIQSRAIEDDEFQELVRHDIRVAVVQKSQLMPALAAAYNSAPPPGRQFLEKTLAELDPSVLAQIRSGGERR